MKTLLFLLTTLFPLTSHAIEVFEGTPRKSYTIISPLSSDKGTIDKAFKKLKKKAEKLGADAIINYSCVAGEDVKAGLLKIRLFSSDAVCSGTAVKWK